MAGQIIPRGERTWLVRMFLGRDDKTGKRLYHNHTVHGTKSEAQKYLTGALRDRDLGTFASAARITVGALMDELLLDYKNNGKSYEWAEMVVRVHLRPHFGAMRAARVTTEQLRAYIGLRQDAGAANGTINRELALLRRAFNIARKSSPPRVSMVPHFPMLKENNVRKGFFEHDAFIAVRQALPEEVRPVLTFAYYTGCRRGEILALEWSQVDLDERVVRLEPGTTKNKDGRMIPLAPELYETLRLQREARDRYFPTCPRVFSRASAPILDFRHAWEKACKAAGLVEKVGDEEKPTRLFHDLRRTGVRNLIRAGVPERVAMMISGHRTRAVFDRYNIVSEADLKEAARRLGEHMAHKGAQSGSWHTIGTQEAPEPKNAESENPAKLLN